MLADLSIHVAEYSLTGHQCDHAHVRHLPPFCPGSWVFLWEVFEAKDLLYVRPKSCEAIHGRCRHDRYLSTLSIHVLLENLLLHCGAPATTVLFHRATFL